MIELREAVVNSASGDRILGPVSLAIGEGEAAVLVGRSGAGKTTALRLMNGLQRPSSGDVLVEGESLLVAELTRVRRRIGYIIQGVGLFPHRTVFDNIAVVPRLLGWPEEEIREEAETLLAFLELPFEKYASRFPRSLSGGEQQRVGIARALVFRPTILLCDEPFAALDPIVRRELQRAVVALHRQRRVTVVFVTHDLNEALTVGERVIHFEAGRVVADVPREQYTTWSEPLVQRFVESASAHAGL
jgi:osmoprotectant transport system ATP-binding protein